MSYKPIESTFENNNNLGNDELRKLYKSMCLIRRFEQKVVELVNKNEIPGVTHEYVGQEAVAVGVCHALKDNDIITSTHRGHGHILAKGGDPGKMIAELMGKVDGYNKGRGGSMHVADLSLGIYGANGIVGGGVPIAAGAAFASRYNGNSDVAVAFFGDGGINQGVVHETMNLAAIWKLPIIFVCENNGYAATTPLNETVAIDHLSDRSSAYGIYGESVNGMNVLSVYDAMTRAVNIARAGKGATLLECKTYRFVGHFTAEASRGFQYRTDKEMEAWRLEDPIVTFSEFLKTKNVCNPNEVESEVEQMLEEAISFARDSELPLEKDALEGMYAVNYSGFPAKGW